MKKSLIVVFGCLNLVQGLLVGAIPLIVEAREPAVGGLLYGLSASMLIAGPALIFAGRIGKWVATLACYFHGITGTVLATLIAGSASYLYSIYGHHGHAAGAIGFVLAVVTLIVFWLIPAHELHFLHRQKG